MKRIEPRADSTAPLMHEGDLRTLSPFKQSDWGGVLTPSGATVSGWRTLSPQRHALMSLVLLGVGMLYGQLSLILAGGLLTGWVTRRARLDVSPQHGSVLTLSSCGLSYARVSLPLWAPLKVERHGALSTVWLGSLESSYHVFELFVCDEERANELAFLYREGTRRAQSYRLIRPEVISPKSTGEWQISLIELIPLLSGPRARHGAAHSHLSWWAPSLSSCLLAIILLLLSPFFLVIAPDSIWPLVLSVMIALSSILGVREALHINAKQWTWSRQWLCFTIRTQRWSPELRVSLVMDSQAPHGRHLLLFEPQDPRSCHPIGHAWDSDWIWSQIRIAREKL